MIDRLEDIKSRTEQFTGELERERYHVHVGRSGQLKMAGVYDRFEDLASPSLIEFLRGEIDRRRDAAGDSEPVRKLRSMLANATRSAVEYHIRDLLDQIWNLQRHGMIEIGDRSESMPFLWSHPALRTESDRSRRSSISQARDAFMSAQLNPLLRELWRGAWKQFAELGHRNSTEALELILDLDVRRLEATVAGFLSGTRDLYSDQLAWFARKKGLHAEDLHGHDLGWLVGCQDLVRYFRHNDWMSKALDFVRKMGLDPTAGGRVQMDVVTPPEVSLGIRCFALRVPEEIRLAGILDDGLIALQQFLGELGRGLFLAQINPSIDWEYRRLGDYSLDECYASTFSQLVCDKIWLKKVLGLSLTGEHLRYERFADLTELRRLCALLSWATTFCSEMDLVAQGGRFQEMLGRAMMARYPGASYLFEIDPFLSSVHVLRGRMLESVLTQYLRENFDEDWFLNPRAGEFFRELWGEGRRFTGEQLVRHLGFPSLTLDFVVDALESSLR